MPDPIIPAHPAPDLPHTHHYPGWLLYVKGSFFSVFVGWLSSWLLAVPLSAVLTRGGWSSAFYFVLAYAVIILAVWLVLFLPIYVCTPRRSVLWQWPVCTSCGLGAGTLIALLLLGGDRLEALFGSFFPAALLSAVLGGTVGAVTCLTAALTANYFLGPPPAPAKSLPSWVRWMQAIPPIHCPARLADPIRQRGDELLRWVGARFSDLSGQ